jgi:hypothetical protein
MTTQESSLTQTLQKAFSKLGTTKESTLCHYIPSDTGGYIHHFTFRKMKNENTKELADLIENYILKPITPVTVTPKQRAARGSRKRKDLIQLNRQAIERLLFLARTAGDKEAISLLMPRKSLATCKRELINSIRQDRVDVELWSAYTETNRAHEFAMTDTNERVETSL